MVRDRSVSLDPQRFAAVSSVALWSLIAIVITGASVRLTGSGLGCSDWPTCEPGELVPATEFHAWVEFGNRMITGLVALAVIAAVSGSLLRVPRRRDLVWWSAALVAGVLAQVLLGAVTVLSHLSPPIVMAHFLLSAVLVAAATVLAARARVPDRVVGKTAGAASDQVASRAAGVSQKLRQLRAGCAVMVAALLVALFTGTIVTATGPHGGDEDVERLGFSLGNVARIHGITVVVSLGLLLALVVWVARQVVATRAAVEQADGSGNGSANGAADTAGGTGASSASQDQQALLDRLLQVLRRAEILLVVLAVQGVIGYVQYFNQLPVLLVGLHVTGATLAVVALTRLVLAAITSPPKQPPAAQPPSEQSQPLSESAAGASWQAAQMGAESSHA